MEREAQTKTAVVEGSVSARGQVNGKDAYQMPRYDSELTCGSHTMTVPM